MFTCVRVSFYAGKNFSEMIYLCRVGLKTLTQSINHYVYTCLRIYHLLTTHYMGGHRLSYTYRPICKTKTILRNEN